LSAELIAEDLGHFFLEIVAFHRGKIEAGTAAGTQSRRRSRARGGIRGTLTGPRNDESYGMSFEELCTRTAFAARRLSSSNPAPYTFAILIA
jgi:hypothetical protein